MDSTEKTMKRKWYFKSRLRQARSSSTFGAHLSSLIFLSKKVMGQTNFKILIGFKPMTTKKTMAQKQKSNQIPEKPIKTNNCKGCTATARMIQCSSACGVQNEAVAVVPPHSAF
jgi:TPP-dependent indolepyruvate ferredoxin oxidoreductase alpha subunit